MADLQHRYLHEAQLACRRMGWSTSYAANVAECMRHALEKTEKKHAALVTRLRTELEAAKADRGEACERAKEDERDRLYEAWVYGAERNNPVVFWSKHNAMRPSLRARSRALTVPTKDGEA